MSPTGRRTKCTTLQPLTRQEIERRIQDVVSEISAPAEQDPASAIGSEGFRWIAPGELVRRMRQHLVLN